MTREDKPGISQQGDTNVIGAVSFGDNSRAISRGQSVQRTSSEDVGTAQAMLSQLLQRIDHYAAELPEPERARNAARMLRDELGESDRDPGTVQRLLGRLRSAVEMVPPLVKAVTAVADAITQVMV